MPNARFRELRRPFALLAMLGRAIDFHALNGRPVDLVTLVLGPEPANKPYLDVLTTTSRA
jgi:PTS system nitrogen regulatory IIA component